MTARSRWPKKGGQSLAVRSQPNCWQKQAGEWCQTQGYCGPHPRKRVIGKSWWTGWWRRATWTYLGHFAWMGA